VKQNGRESDLKDHVCLSSCADNATVVTVRQTVLQRCRLCIGRDGRHFKRVFSKPHLFIR